MITPASARARNQAEFCVLRSSRGTETRSSRSALGRAQQAAIASAPCLPGLPEARRSSISFLPANSDRLAAACVNSLQAKLRLLRRAEAPHDLLHHVGLHVAEQQLLLGFLRQHLRVVEAHIARQLHGALRHVIGALAVVQAKADAVAQLELAHAARPGQRKDFLQACFFGELQHGVRLLRVIDDLGIGSGLDIALEIERDAARGARHVNRAERHLRRAAQPEAAAREREAKNGDEDSHQTTRLTSRPGTTTTFFTLWPATKRCTFGLASARPSIAARSAAFGTRIEPRSLPFTCTTSSTSSCSSAAASGSGHGARITSSPKPSSRHR